MSIGTPGYYRDHHIIQWFWQIVEAYSTEQKLRLLQVCTHLGLIIEYNA